MKSVNLPSILLYMKGKSLVVITASSRIGSLSSLRSGSVCGGSIISFVLNSG